MCKNNNVEVKEMDKQVKMYSVGANAFYEFDEILLEQKIYDVGNEIKTYKEYLGYEYLCELDNEKVAFTYDEYVDNLNKLRDKNTSDKDKEKIYKTLKVMKDKLKEEKTLTQKQYNRLNKREKLIYDKKTKQRLKDEKFKQFLKDNKNYIQFLKDKDELNKELNKLIKSNKNIRILDETMLKEKSKISIFESNLSRVMGIKTDELCEDIITVKINKIQYKVMEQIINYGCTIKDKNYIYFTSSAGQIRTKKIVLIKESKWEEIKLNIMVGLTIEDINKYDGCNINKYLAYLALCMGATQKWEGFDIDRAIVVKDFETVVNGEVDYINKEVKEIIKTCVRKENGSTYDRKTKKLMLDSKPIRKNMDITITHSDGCGIMLPSISKKNFMFRLGWFKGLLTPVDFMKFIEKNKNDGATYKITDIWNKEWDLEKDNIQIIFTQSQFKMWKYYSSWEDYKTKFKENNCHASKCNIEQDKFKEANMNYQMWQTLTDITDDEIKYFTKPIKDFITNAYTDKDTMLKMLGVNKENKSYFTNCIKKYPALLNEYHTEQTLRGIINSKRKDAKEGKIKVDNAKYTFLIPDVYAWMEYLFLNNKNPKGLLNRGEVCCKLYEGINELIVNRSPHLYREWGVRNNINNEGIKEWFISDGVYTSCDDLLSKLLQYDNDGDKSLVIGEKELVKIAKRNMEGIVPLYYNMGKASPQKITNTNISSGLLRAFKTGNVGMYSNTLTCFWNGENKEDLDLAKIITALNNYNIDSAKTMEMPKVSDDIKEKMDALNKLPYFFQFAKDMDREEVAEMNDSTVNRICKNIEDITQDDFKFDEIGKFNHKMLMKSMETRKKSKALTDKYDEVNKEKDMKFMVVEDDDVATKIGIWKDCRKKIQEVIESEELSFEDATDIIIKYVFKNYKSEKKTLMWKVFGRQIEKNLDNNLKKKTSCYCCGQIIEKANNKTKYCKECKDIVDKENKKKSKNK